MCLKGIDTLFFDFDGVILDSVDCKTNAFMEMYKEYGEEIVQKVKEYHLIHNGISRFEKIKYWHQHLLGIKLSEKEIQQKAQLFSKLVFEQVISAQFIPGAEEFIKEKSSKYKCYIITGTPQNEIELILKERSLSSFFKSVHGSPKNKIHWTEYLIQRDQLIRENILFIGDATTDYQTAIHSNLHFALRLANYNKAIFKSESILKFTHFNQLNDILNPSK